MSPNYLQISHKSPTFEEKIYWEHKLVPLLKVLRVIDKNRSMSIPSWQQQEGPSGLDPSTKQNGRKTQRIAKHPGVGLHGVDVGVATPQSLGTVTEITSAGKEGHSLSIFHFQIKNTLGCT